MADASQVLVASNGKVWVAPLGTAIPSTPTTTPANAWTDLGYLDEDGVDLTAGADWQEIEAWQSVYPIRRVAGSRSLELEMHLHQWNLTNFKLGFGGGDSTLVSTGVWKYEPPEPEFVDERMMMVDFADGAKHYRWVIRRGMISDDTETNLKRTDSGKLSLKFAINGEAGIKPWQMITDDPAFAPAA